MKKLFGSAENIADRAFLQSITLSIAAILLCIVALCSVTYAWFVADISSSQNTITAAFFDVDVTVYDVTHLLAANPVTDDTAGEEKTEGEPVPTPAAPIQIDGDYGIFTLEAGHIYQLVLKIPAAVTASKGYCDILVDGNVVGVTPVIENVGEKQLQITITVHQNALLMAQPKWGTPVGGALGQSMTIGSAPVEPIPTEPAPTEPEATEPEATEPEATEPEATEPTGSEEN